MIFLPFAPNRAIILACGVLTFLNTAAIRAAESDFQGYAWNEVNAEASCAARAGLEVVELNDAFYLMGGRTPIDPDELPVFGASTIWGDVWKSENQGAT